MKKKLFSAILLFILIINISACTKTTRTAASINSSAPKQLTQKEKLEDFEYMYNVLKDNYPYFEVNKRLNGIDWLARKEQFINEIKLAKNDEDFYYTLQDIISQLKCGHAYILDRGMYNADKKLFSQNKNTAGKAWFNQLNKLNVQRRYNGMEYTASTSEISTVTPDNVVTKIIDGKIAYISIHIFNSLNIESDLKIINSFFLNINNYKALIIDIRGNPGGSDNYWSEDIVPYLINKPLIENTYVVYRGGKFTESFIGSNYKKLIPITDIASEKLKNIPPEVASDFKYYEKCSTTVNPRNVFGYMGKIYLLIDKRVFSSSEGFAAFAKDTGFATLVGKTTGGDGIGSDPAICALPHSGFVFSFAKQMGLTADGTCNFEYKTQPDIIVNAKVTGDVNTDEAIQAVIKREQ